MNSRITLSIALTGLLALAPTFALAQVSDPAGDFVSTYTGPKNGDLDVILSNVEVQRTDFVFTATLNGSVGTSATSTYVWGIDRGAGTARFAAAPNNQPNIFFDSVVTLTGAGVVGGRDLISNTVLTGLSAEISGNSVLVHVPFDQLPTKGLALDQYTWNLWPRLGSQITDFAPDSTNARVTAVPEPGTLALLFGGSVVGMGLLRRKRSRK